MCRPNFENKPLNHQKNDAMPTLSPLALLLSFFINSFANIIHHIGYSKKYNTEQDREALNCSNLCPKQTKNQCKTTMVNSTFTNSISSSITIYEQRFLKVNFRYTVFKSV